MPVWEDLLHKPAPLAAGDNLDEWFGRIAERLLNGCTWVIGREPHRFMEIEFYYHGDGHPDTFAHCDPLQLECGRWYFHRSGGVYRSGSFKGIDLTFGDGTAHGGVLIRGIEAPDGTLIDGPSLTVDMLLDKTGATGVAQLDTAVGKRAAWEAGKPLLLQEEAGLPARNFLRTARVGLSLKKWKKAPEPPCYIMRPYRYLADPRRTAKGKVHMVLALHAGGVPPDKIHKQTGCPKAAVGRYIADFEAGRQQPDFGPYYGKDLSPKDLCQLHGTWYANFGAPQPTGPSQLTGPA
jgi:hypothetical protein